MLISRISTCAVFDPEAVKTLVAAFDDACAALNVTDRADPRAMTVAKKIIEHARRGERDPIRLREAALTELQRDAPSLARERDPRHGAADVRGMPTHRSAL
jgi:hypothetical protein